MRRATVFWISLFLCFLPCQTVQCEEPQALTTQDIQKVMEQLFEFHIDKKEMSPLLVERSLKIYLEQSDPSHSYLLSNEVNTFLRPNDNLLRRVLQDYQQGRFRVYYEANDRIQKGMVRGRLWRKEWEAEPHRLVQEARKLEEKTPSDKNFASNERELKERHRTQLLKLISLHLKQIPDNLPREKDGALVALCEKQIVLAENPYLGLGEEGENLTEAKREHQVVLRILKSMAKSLDAHTAYYSPDEAYAMRIQLEKGMCGIGVVLHEGIEGVTVSEVLKGGPAHQTGMLQVGDTIVEVDGTSVQAYSFAKVLDILRGSEGSKAKLGVLRRPSKDVKIDPIFLRVELTRSKITIEDKRVDISYEPYGDGIVGKIALYSFYEGDNGVSSEKDLRAAIEKLREVGPLHGLVLDLRDNTGGFLSQSVKVCGLFINSGVVVISKYSDGKIKYYRTLEGGPFYDGPLVLLVSRGSASATEIVAQTLQDYGVALVVGDTQTFGKGTIQHQTVTNDRTNSFFKVTIGRYYTVSGKSTQIDGVKSDIVVPTALNFEEVGEIYLEYPLPPDSVAAAFEDPLTDVDPFARKWFAKYYLPNIQKQQTYWSECLPVLRANSKRRIAENKDFQLFLKKIKEELEPIAVGSFGENDLPLQEAINIVKDMVLLQKPVETVSAQNQLP